MSRLIDLNQEFYDMLGLLYPDKSVALPVERRAAFMAYIIGEVVEYGNASALSDQIDALIDAMYFIYDAFLEMGIDPDPFYELIHKSNMSKKWEDGEPRWDYTKLPPKLLKPSTWESPNGDIRKLLYKGVK